MSRAAVRILHPPPADDAGELTRLLSTARGLVADDLAARWRALGAGDVLVDRSAADAPTFGHRLRDVAAQLDRAGLVVLGSGSIPLASDEDLNALLAAAANGEGRGLTNNRYSSDVLAVGDASILARVPDLPSDNALPRWLEREGMTVDELPNRWRLALDLDSPLDLELLRRHPDCPEPLRALARSMAHRTSHVATVLEQLTDIAQDPGAELLVAGRLSTSTLQLLEARTACRIRALVEERGLRASASLSGAPALRRSLGLDSDDEAWRPASVLGLLLERELPSELGLLLHRLGDGALVDTRVLLAHRFGVDEAGWPSPEDRYASDLLLPDRVGDPWLRAITRSARGAHPISLGGHSLLGPGLPLALGLPPPDVATWT